MQDPKRKSVTEAGFIGHNRSTLAWVDVAYLKLVEGDPRKYSERDVTLAAEALRRLPSSVPLPVVVNDQNEVLVGGLFLAAARQLGLKTLQIVRHDGLSRIEQKQYAVAINQLLSKGEWDPLAMDTWVREFEDQIEDFSHLSIGFDNGELDGLLGLASLDGCTQEEEDFQPVAGDPVTRPGMTWLAGNNRVMCGSGTNPDDFALLMDGQTADMAITDPPYGCEVDGFVSKKGLHRNFVEGAGEKGERELAAFFFGFAQQLRAALRPGALPYIFIDWRSLNLLLRACEPVFGSLVQMCCWVKNRAGMGSFYRSQHELVLVFKVPGGKHTNNVRLGVHGRNRSNVWEYPSAASSRSGREGDMLKAHPTPKGVEMIADAILDSTNRRERVIDCFLGSGTTLIAAERTGRICYAMELDPLYVDVAIRRWQSWTGLEAIDAETGRTFGDLEADVAGRNGGLDHE